MRLAICLMTADRADLTEATLDSLARTNPNLPAIRLHADDGSADHANIRLAQGHGFLTVSQTRKRQGQILGLRSMWSTAIQKCATHILHLENDQEFTGPLPLDLVDRAQCVRLYGRFKTRDPLHPRAVTSVKPMGCGEPIIWAPEDGLEGWERGFAHWGGQASITDAALLLRGLLRANRGDALTMKHIGVELNRLDTLRPVENITFHMDAPHTPGHFLRGSP